MERVNKAVTAWGLSPTAAVGRKDRAGRVSPMAQREVILALFLLICYGFFRQGPAWNEWSRYDLVVALVDDHTLQIDPYHENTGDKAFFNGHYYSDKAPGGALIALPTYVALHALSLVRGTPLPSAHVVMQVFTLTAAGVPTVVLAVLLLRFLRTLVNEAWAVLLVMGYALGTIAFPFATMYFGHAASTCFLFAAFYLLWRARRTTSNIGVGIAGLIAGFGVLTELPVVLGVCILVFYAYLLGWHRMLWFVAGGIPCLLILLLYNWATFDSPFQFGYAYSVNFGAYHRRGLMGIHRPQLATLEALLFAPRGLLRLSPWLGLAPLGLCALRARRSSVEVGVCTAIVVAFLVYNSGYFIPFGGGTPGPRFLTPMLPFATVLVALAPHAFRPLLKLMVPASILLCTIATATGPNVPEAVEDPLGDLWLPRLLAHDLVETTAWLRFGLPGMYPLFVLSLITVLTGVALVATSRTQPGFRSLVYASGSLLIILGLGLTTPTGLWVQPVPQAANVVDHHPEQVATDRHIDIVAGGITVLPRANQRPHIAPWAQIENRDTLTAHTKVIFSVYDAGGQRVWAAWHGNVFWHPRERQRLRVEWNATGAEPGDYRVSVAITSLDGSTIFATDEDIGHILVSP